MHISHVFGAVAAFAAVAAGQAETESYTSSSPASKTATSSAGPATISITVGAEGNVFSPRDTKAKVGDTLRFVFYPTGHSVARGDFKFPCIPYEYSGVHRTGFWSGTKTPQVATGNVFFDVRVNDTDPIFYYCAAPASCYDHHMIGVVNARDNETFDAQMGYAEKAQFQLKPGDPWPSETAGELPSETRAGGSHADNSNSDSDDHAHLSPGAIAGIAIGGAAVLILGAALLYICGRRGGFDKAYRKSVGAPLTSPGVPQGQMAEGNYLGVIPHNPKSPGQASFSTYAGVTDQDAYRSMTTSPQQTYYNPSQHGTPPPFGSVHQGYPVYHTGNPQQGVYSPPGELSAHQYAQVHQPPVELPTTVGTPISPPQPHPTSARRDSWTTGEEGQFRPGNK